MTSGSVAGASAAGGIKRAKGMGAHRRAEAQRTKEERLARKVAAQQEAKAARAAGKTAKKAAPADAESLFQTFQPNARPDAERKNTPAPKSREAAPQTAGGEPRVSLLPVEVLKARNAKAIRRRLRLGVIGVAAVVVLATILATAFAIQAQMQLTAAQERTTDLLAQQATFSDVRQVQQQVELTRAAQQVGGSTEVDWKAYLESVRSTLPGSVTITSVDVDSASPMAVYSQPTEPLQGARIATLSFSAESSTLPDVPTWLTSLAQLPGFADALPDSVTLDETSGVYTVAITMHVNDAAFTHRFDEKKAE
ncbi:hypothetical protein WDJ51_06960 [Rathayibacter sp. YIM 133350]|uniref:hypothetical protein n=1 Tax=Rathayibacter sp. YIM 133350 TaxID=3131992 RepID=UPI00307F2777